MNARQKEGLLYSKTNIFLNIIIRYNIIISYIYNMIFLKYFLVSILDSIMIDFRNTFN